MTATDNPSVDWDLYWAHGYLTSCANAFPGNYEGRIREVWEEFFAQLDPDARILDLATGNGAIALMGAAYGLTHNANFEIHGIDRAKIDPASAWSGDPAVLGKVQFFGRTAAENTGYPDGYFSAVTGQYALEYTNLPESIAELSRILAPGARGRFVMHHPDSVVIRTSREEESHGQLIFEDTQLFEKAEKLLHRIINAESAGNLAELADDEGAQADRVALNEAAAQVSAAIETAMEPELLTTALGYVGRAIQERKSLGPEAALALLNKGQVEIRANLARLDDLLNAVVDEKKLKTIQSLMLDCGLQSANPSRLTYDHDGQQLLMGWLMDVHRLRIGA